MNRYHPVFEPCNKFTQTVVNEAKVQEATDRWRLSKNYPGEGGQRFFHFALDLRSAGMQLWQIELRLHEEAKYGRSPSERRAQIKSIMDSLRKSSRRLMSGHGFQLSIRNPIPFPRWHIKASAISLLSDLEMVMFLAIA